MKKVVPVLSAAAVAAGHLHGLLFKEWERGVFTVAG